MTRRMFPGEPALTEGVRVIADPITVTELRTLVRYLPERKRTPEGEVELRKSPIAVIRYRPPDEYRISRLWVVDQDEEPLLLMTRDAGGALHTQRGAEKVFKKPETVFSQVWEIMGTDENYPGSVFILDKSDDDASEQTGVLSR